MQRYEYKTATVPFNVSQLQNALNEFAADGWRCVGFVPNGPHGGLLIVALERELPAAAG